MRLLGSEFVLYRAAGREDTVMRRMIGRMGRTDAILKVCVSQEAVDLQLLFEKVIKRREEGRGRRSLRDGPARE